MRKKRITADELTFLIVEKMRENDEIATSHPAIAVVPHATLNWAVVIPGKTRRKEPQSVERIERIQSDLRIRYMLTE